MAFKYVWKTITFLVYVGIWYRQLAPSEGCHWHTAIEVACIILYVSGTACIQARELILGSNFLKPIIVDIN